MSCLLYVDVPEEIRASQIDGVGWVDGGQGKMALAKRLE